MRTMAQAILILPVLCSSVRTQTQNPADSLSGSATLQNCVQYALAHQPRVRQSLLDEEITERSIQSKLSDWYPHVDFNYSVQHNYELPTSLSEGNPPIKVGLLNSSSGQFTASQVLFNREVLLASSSGADVRLSMSQQTAVNTIDVIVNVNKAFYGVLVTKEDLEVLDEDIVRLKQSLKDAYDQYTGGIVDKIDYKRATISLNNAQAERKQSEELLKARYALLREQMGYPSDLALSLAYDTGQMEREALMDTTQALDVEHRIEFQLLQTQRHLQEDDLAYEKWSFLPSLTLSGAYNLNYQNDRWANLYERDYPSSYVSLQLSLPIFEGGKRLQDIRQARLELERFDYDMQSLKDNMATEYAQAMASYKSNLNNYYVLKDNLELARDVYETVQLQYKAGTKSYLEVITAETDLRAAQINHTNALYQLLSSKIDVQKALGILHD